MKCQKLAWNRAKVSRGVAVATWRTHAKLWMSMSINENLGKSMKAIGNQGIHEMQEACPDSSRDFCPMAAPGMGPGLSLGREPGAMKN